MATSNANVGDSIRLYEYMERRIAILKHNGRIRTAETYRSALNCFQNFLKGRDPALSELSSEIMESYQAWQLRRGISLNSISFYNRILRAVYNRAVEECIITDRNPFKRVYTGVDKTVKRALPLSTIRAIKTLDLSAFPTLEYARDMFLMSFYLRGMSFIDMAFLKKSDLRHGYLTYRRRKTGRQLVIEWTCRMQHLLEKYPINPTQYLLPILCKQVNNERAAYHNAGYRINRSLKIIASMVGISIPLTLYVARHSWASIAKAKGIPLSVISQGMGHDSESTTWIYLASLDTSIVDNANRLILDSL